ncbi:MAG: RNA polymerase sigma factor [Spirochaetes bacterium]|jgi:RNA polymerase sigma-70 factor (ECF subfamily)|nr:RNA polymerase sigma factor [Spirochaetota bacterium]
MSWKKRDFAEAYNDYYPLIFSAVFSKVSRVEDAEDICQEIFIKFYEKIDTIENHRKWLYGAMKFELLTYYRKKHPDVEDVEEMLQDASLSYVNGFKDIRIILTEAIENMDNFEDESDKILFDLVAIFNFTYEEAAGQLGFSVRQVRYKYNKIAGRLVSYLGKKGIKSLEDLL